MRHAIAYLLLPFLATAAGAQDTHLHLWGGPLAGAMNMSSFDAFGSSFNTVNQRDLTEDLGGLGFAVGGQLGATVMLTEHIGMSLSYQQHRSSASASFADGSSRHFRHDLYTPINGGFIIRAWHIDIHPRLGYCQANLRSWTEYADGTVSYGNERLLNGTFRTTGLFAGMDLGGRISLGEKMDLCVGAAWYGVSGSEFIEPNTARAVDHETVYPISIPTDWQRWLDLRAANDLTSYDTDDVVRLKGSWYYAYVNLMVRLK